MMQKIINYCHILAMLLGVFLFPIKGFAQYNFNADNLPAEFSLHNYTTVVDLGQQQLNIKEVISNYNSFKQKKLSSENDDLGFTDHHFWAKTLLRNSTTTTLKYYLETARPITDLVELYVVDNTTAKVVKMVSGDAMHYRMRSFDNRKSVFELQIAPQANLSLYLHLKSDGEVLKIPMMLYSAENFIKRMSIEQFVFGIFYGMLGIVAIIYFFFFFALKEKTFLYYSLYVVFVGLLQFGLDGFFYQLITPSGGWFSQHAVLLFAIIGALLSGKYSEVFLRIKKYSKGTYKLFKLSYTLLLVLLFCTLFIPATLTIAYPLVNVLGLIFLLLIIYSICYLYYKKKPIDPLFTIGIFFLIAGFAVFILNNFGLVPNNFLTQNSSKVGTGLEIIFLSLSMSNLIRNLKNEKNELNRIALVRSEEMNDLKSYFLSNISHELRTPLNAIMNLIDSISNEVQDDAIKKNCQIIKYSSHSLLSSVNDILDFSKIEKGELQLENTPFDPVKVLEKIKNSADSRANDKGLKFHFSKSEGIPSLLLGDVNRLAQVVNNVVSNAIKFTSEGFVSFDISSEAKPNNRASLILTVSDSGVGIPKNKMDRIFDSFSQDNIDNKRKFGGLGLGLYIVKTIVDMQNGNVEMKSVVNEGTTCKITLEFDVVQQEVKELRPVETEEFDLAGKKILVVEDNPINQMVIKMIVKKWLNTTVIYANNGQEGLDILKRESFDIILMDLQMPVMDGYEATIAIRNGEAGERNTNIPIIAVTADVMETTKQRVKEIGMNHYLSKPIKKETLYQMIKELA